jgi:hypothetical protein
MAVHRPAEMVVFAPVVEELGIEPDPDVTVQVTAAPGTGLPFPSVTRTTRESKKPKLLSAHPSQISCPFPCTIEIFCGVWPRAAPEKNRAMSAGKNRMSLNLTKTYLLITN